jgi:DNA-directed RNA polymerase specialized sigma24 family protein
MAKLPRAKRNYVNNKTLYEEMIKYKDKLKFAEEMGRTPPSVPNYVGQCFLQICNRLSTKPNFMNYSYRDEMVADAIENCVSAAHSFDPEKSSNPFAYFTQIAWNAFIRRIHKEKKQAYIKHKNFENSGIMDELYDQQDGSHTIQVKHNEYSDDIIRNFESKLAKNLKKTKVGLEKFVEEETNEELAPSTS